MKRLLIIYPHWPPSNLAGVHRPRLIANFIPEFGWHPVVLTVKSEFYEEALDRDIEKTVAPTTEVHYVNAFKPMKRLRFFGDIGIRSFYQLYQGALDIIKKSKIDFIWIPIPSFYAAVLGRLLNNTSGIPYGIDYIDPWVNGFTNYENVLSKAGVSNAIAKILEPYAVKRASLISGVSTSYYQAVLDRNFKGKKIEHIGMPYGFDPADHEILLEDVACPWDQVPGVVPFVYAGAFLPKSHLFIDLLFQSISRLKKEGKWDSKIRLYFLGTGNYPGKTIGDYAQECGISESVVELHQRFPFLHVLHFLSKSSGVMVIGSTEKHYTASKIFQALLSKKPVFALLHEESSASQILKECAAADYLCLYRENDSKTDLEQRISMVFEAFVRNKNKWAPVLEVLNKYSSKQSALLLAQKLDLIISVK